GTGRGRGRGGRLRGCLRGGGRGRRVHGETARRVGERPGEREHVAGVVEQRAHARVRVEGGARLRAERVVGTRERGGGDAGREGELVRERLVGEPRRPRGRGAQAREALRERLVELALFRVDGGQRRARLEAQPVEG